MFDYQGLFSNAPVGICVLRNRVFVQCNHRFEEIFGYGDGELIGSSILVLYPSAEMFRYIGKTYGHFFERHAFYRDERPVMRKDGSMVWCVVTGKALDPDNPGLGQIWVVQDISEHKRIEDNLKENIEKLELMVQQRTIELRRHINTLNIEIATRKKAEETAQELQHKFQSVFHMTPVGISLTGLNGRILETNNVFRETIGDGSGKEAHWSDIRARFSLADGTRLSADRLPRVVSELTRGNVDSIEIGMRRKRGGRMTWLNVSSSELVLKGSPAILTVFTDITYRKRIEELERLRYAELTRLGRINSMAEMSAALAHQMGQPLVAALNYLHGCRLRLEPLDGVSEILGSVGLSITYVEQAGEILRHVRDFVCRHHPEKVPENLNAIIEDTISFLDFEFHKNGVVIDRCLDEALPLVPLCKIEIQQVLFNLMKNGMEAMIALSEGQRRLRIGSECHPGGAEVAVFVEDRGTATVRGRSAKVFQPLYTTKPDGIGIGLTICRCIIESHGGKLSFTQMGKQGSRLVFTLPLGAR